MRHPKFQLSTMPLYSDDEKYPSTTEHGASLTHSNVVQLYTKQFIVLLIHILRCCYSTSTGAAY